MNKNEEITQTKGIVSNRRNDILSYLQEHKVAKTNELSELLSISPLTVRRDLQSLEEEGLVKRFYGGVSLIENPIVTSSISNPPTVSLTKKALAKYAASLVNDGDTIFINSSSTALLLLEYLDKKQVVVVTNNGNALKSKVGPNVELVLTGGELHGRKRSMVGDFATLILSMVTADKCFLGVSGISSDSGISTSVLKETLINKKMIERCNGPIYILADSSKVEKHHNFSSGDITDISHLITDDNVSNDQIAAFNSKNVEVITIDCNDKQDI
ncbi:transcriptional regulator, DeoR family [Clostridium cavendishii DSM 21758]|uniref:Transcriptional regulator, DeoR family n=1 Tax=Clostridium cavendishii DSM 21758 TaxID=1121302 RepID=A0A1M6GZY0_9CLOT|nr:DeoR/GlpR family DNA-binding transcription regulator [Clostridium cavendishii]SHJ15470.1 transcriptional regulator, DeoR family [Clostridium cavendishii DSM 21758]